MNDSKRRRLTALGLVAATLFAPGFAGASGESDSGTANVEATLIQPIDLSPYASLSFGSLIKNTLTGPVKIVLDPQVSAPALVTSTNSAEVLPLAGEGESEAGFTVTGEGNRLVQVSVDSSITIRKGAGGTPQTEMTVTIFNADVYDNAGDPDLHDDVSEQFTLPADGDAVLELGGTLQVQPDDELGSYSGTVTVTVSYV